MTGHEGTTRFGVDEPITREQFATVIYCELTGETDAALLEGTGSPFLDADQVSEYAQEAMAWCIEVGIVQGTEGYLMSQENALRCEIVTMMMRVDTLSGTSMRKAACAVGLHRAAACGRVG